MWEINGKRTSDEKEVMAYFGLKYKPMCKSLLDTDLYKFSMGQTYHHQFGRLKTTWDFRARNVGAESKHPEKYSKDDLTEIQKQIMAYCALRFEDEELEYLHTKCPWIKIDYINFLKFWHPIYEDFIIESDDKTGIKLSFAGVQEYVEYYEIPVLEICAETYYRNHYNYDDLLSGYKTETEKKIMRMNEGDYHFGAWSEFGARRRLSFEAQDWLIGKLNEEKSKSGKQFGGFIGTSNVYLAKKYGVVPVGTCAHEFIECVGQGDPSLNPAYSNKFAMEAWVKEYGVWNGIWLTDTIGDELCRRDMQKTYATLFSGVRNDSGDPFVWADNWIEHFNSLGIDPKTKTLLFSNSINSLELWDKLCRHVEGRAKPAFGIGTYWSGPQTIDPLNIVAKVVLVNGHDVAKLSDDAGKTMSRSPEYVHYLKRTLDWRLQSVN
jgi:nicotinate phosphoribosyltransferase